MLKQQDAGGSIVFIASKNALVAGKNAAAYSSAKAAELHLARCLAEEGGGDGIRVNTVNPDAVLQGSKIWGSSWREERAAAYNLDPEELDEHYRQRNTLKVSIYPGDIAEAVLHFASERRSGKSTGNMLNVDGGVPAGVRALAADHSELHAGRPQRFQRGGRRAVGQHARDLGHARDRVLPARAELGVVEQQHGLLGLRDHGALDLGLQLVGVGQHAVAGDALDRQEHAVGEVAEHGVDRRTARRTSGSAGAACRRCRSGSRSASRARRPPPSRAGCW